MDKGLLIHAYIEEFYKKYTTAEQFPPKLPREDEDVIFQRLLEREIKDSGTMIMNESMKRAIFGETSTQKMLSHFHRFAKKENRVPWKAEWEIGRDEDGIHRRVDAVFRRENSDGKLHLDLYDWKTSKNGQKLTLDSIKEKTTPQLRNYKAILEKKTIENEQVIVDNMYVVVFYPLKFKEIRISELGTVGTVQTPINRHIPNLSQRTLFPSVNRGAGNNLGLNQNN